MQLHLGPWLTGTMRLSREQLAQHEQKVLRSVPFVWSQQKDTHTDMSEQARATLAALGDMEDVAQCSLHLSRQWSIRTSRRGC